MNADSHPLDFFELFLSPDFHDKHFKLNSNIYATQHAAGADHYKGWVPFSLCDIDKGLSLLIRNGLLLAPDIRLHFANPNTNHVYGHNAVHTIWTRGVRRWEEFRAFFHVQDPRLASDAKDP